MNWKYLRHAPWLDTRARFVAGTPAKGRLLDLGTSDGETLRHFAELRPDLNWSCVDLEEHPQNYPPGCEFQKVDLERDRLPWPDNLFDSVTSMHLVEHLHDCQHLIGESARVLKPGGRLYLETPHPKTIALPSIKGAAAGSFAMSFFDFRGHLRLVPAGLLGEDARAVGLEVLDSGTSRNKLFALSWPFFFFAPPSRKKFTAQTHWLGWSAYLIARKPS